MGLVNSLFEEYIGQSHEKFTRLLFSMCWWSVHMTPARPCWRAIADLMGSEQFGLQNLVEVCQ
jgi:hypothetical protein